MEIKYAFMNYNVFIRPKSYSDYLKDELNCKVYDFLSMDFCEYSMKKEEISPIFEIVYWHCSRIMYEEEPCHDYYNRYFHPECKYTEMYGVSFYQYEYTPLIVYSIYIIISLQSSIDNRLSRLLRRIEESEVYGERVRELKFKISWLRKDGVSYNTDFTARIKSEKQKDVLHGALLDESTIDYHSLRIVVDDFFGGDIEYAKQVMRMLEPDLRNLVVNRMHDLLELYHSVQNTPLEYQFHGLHYDVWYEWIDDCIKNGLTGNAPHHYNYVETELTDYLLIKKNKKDEKMYLEDFYIEEFEKTPNSKTICQWIDRNAESDELKLIERNGKGKRKNIHTYYLEEVAKVLIMSAEAQPKEICFTKRSMRFTYNEREASYVYHPLSAVPFLCLTYLLYGFTGSYMFDKEKRMKLASYLLKTFPKEFSGFLRICDGDNSSRSKAQGHDLPNLLNTDEARKYFKELIAIGWLDESCMPNRSELSVWKIALLADAIAAKLHIIKKWVVFEPFWGINNLSKRKQEGIKNEHYSEFEKDLKKLGL